MSTAIAPFTVPAGNKTAGQGGFIGDINNAYAALAAVAGINVLDSQWAGGADPTGVSDSAPAIQAALNAVPATGGIVFMPPGTYRTNSTLNVTVPATFLVGAGRRATTIAYYGSGDCIYMHATSYAAFTAFTYQCGGIKGLTIDGTNSAAATSGVNAGDWYALDFDVEVRHFTTVGSYGVHLLNAMGFTEKTRGFIYADHCDTCVGFDVSTTTSTANRSFGYTDLVMEMDGVTGNGVTLTNGAMVYHSRLIVRANVDAGPGSTYAVLKLNGKCAPGVQNPGSASQIASSYLDVQAEANGTTNVQTTINIDVSNNARIYNCRGILDFGFSAQMALSNITPSTAGSNYFQFQGVISGDSNLNPGGASSGFISVAPQMWTRGQFSSAGAAATSLGDFFTLTLSASVTISLTGGTLGATIPGPQRKTFIITQAASGGPYTVTWPKPGSPSVTAPAVYWPGGTAPVMSAAAGAVDKYELTSTDGIHWYGTAAQALS